MKMNLNQKKGDKFLLIKGVCVDEKLLTDKILLSEILRNLPSVINMNPIREPIISQAKNNPGLEGYVPIDESNITISTYTNDVKFVACVHSCKDFDSQKILDYLKKKFQCKDIRFLSCHESDFRGVNND